MPSAPPITQSIDTHPLDDRPITSPDQDKLGRNEFALKINNYLRNYANGTEKPNRVVALYGDWGSGKTSFWNLIRAKRICPDFLSSLNYWWHKLLLRFKLKNPGTSLDDVFDIVDFSPWLCHSPEQLTREFFDALREKRFSWLQKLSSNVNISSYVLKQLDRSSSQSSVFRQIIRGFIFLVLSVLGLFLVPRLSELCSYAGTELLCATGEKYNGIIDTLSFIRAKLNSPVLTKEAIAALLVASASYFLSAVLLVWSEHFWTNSTRLVTIKNSLKRAFEKSKKPLLVVIDDLDRLVPDDLKYVFQLIKANADFDNVIYVLLADHTVLCETLSHAYIREKDPKWGKDYLEKLVQVPLQVPIPSFNTFKNWSTPEILNCINDLKLSEELDHTHFEILVNGAVNHYLNTPRKIIRYLENLKFILPCFMTDKGKLEIDLLDLIGMETLRLFEPQWFNALKFLKSSLLKTIPSDEQLQHSMNTLSTTLSNVLQDTIIATREATTFSEEFAAMNITQFLFPRFGELTERNPRYHRDNTNRISRDHIFDRYFEFSLSNLLTQDEFDIFLNSLTPENIAAAKNLLKDISERNRLNEFFQKIDALESLPEDLLLIFMDNETIFKNNPPNKVLNLVLQTLKDIPLENRVERFIHFSKLSKGFRVAHRIRRVQDKNIETILPFNSVQEARYQMIYQEQFLNALSELKAKNKPQEVVELYYCADTKVLQEELRTAVQPFLQDIEGLLALINGTHLNEYSRKELQESLVFLEQWFPQNAFFKAVRNYLSTNIRSLDGFTRGKLQTALDREPKAESE